MYLYFCFVFSIGLYITLRKPLKCKILIIISIVIHTIGAILQVIFYFGLYTNEDYFDLAPPVTRYAHFGFSYYGAFAFIFLWKSWNGNSIQTFLSNLHKLKPLLKMPISSKIYMCIGLMLSAPASGIKLSCASDISIVYTVKDVAFHFISDSSGKGTISIYVLTYFAYIRLLRYIFPLCVLSFCFFITNCIKRNQESIEKEVKDKDTHKDCVIKDVIENMNEIAKVVNEFDSIFTVDVAWFIFICLNGFICHLYTIILWKDCDSYDPKLCCAIPYY